MKVHLEMLRGRSAGTEIPIRPDRFMIGREAGCDLRPKSLQVSRKHCEILQREGRVFLNDLNSTNGTYLNEVRISREVPVADGDLLGVGPHVFVIKVEVTCEASPAASQFAGQQPGEAVEQSVEADEFAGPFRYWDTDFQPAKQAPHAAKDQK